jgi:hypothetical protein
MIIRRHTSRIAERYGLYPVMMYVCIRMMYWMEDMIGVLRVRCTGLIFLYHHVGKNYPRMDLADAERNVGQRTASRSRGMRDP